MWQELEEEYEQFLENMNKNESLCAYIDETCYEDDYSHNEIEECQEKFVEKITQWLHEYKPGQYVVTSGWCVHVMTVEEAKRRNVWNYEEHIIQ